MVNNQFTFIITSHFPTNVETQPEDPLRVLLPVILLHETFIVCLPRQILSIEMLYRILMGDTVDERGNRKSLGGEDSSRDIQGSLTTLLRLDLMLTSTFTQLGDKPRFHKTQSMGTTSLPRLDTDQTDHRLQRRESDRYGDRTARPVIQMNGSQNSTPKVAMTPISTDAPHAPQTSADIKPLTRMLQQFSQGIVRTSFYANKNESALRTQNKLRREDEKWKDRFDTFRPLAEARQRDSIVARRKLAESDRKLQATKTGHRINTEQIAASLALGGVTVPASKDTDDGKIKRAITSVKGELERIVVSQDEARSAEIGTLRNDLEKVTASVNVVKSNLGQVRSVPGIIDTQSNIQRELHELRKIQKDLGEAQNQREEAKLAIEKLIAGRQTKVAGDSNSKIEDRIKSIGTKIDQVEAGATSTLTGLSARLNDLEKKTLAQDPGVSLDEFNVQSKHVKTLQTNYENLESKLAGLKNILDQEVTDLVNLREVVSGDADSKNGLLDMISSAQEDGGKFRELIKKMAEDMDQLEISVKRIDEGKSRLEIRLNTLEDERSSNDHTSDDVVKITEELAEFKKTYKFEQEEKDDMVSGEVDRLDSMLISQNHALSNLTEKINDMSSTRVDVAPQPPVDTLPSPRLSNGASVEREDEFHRVKELENKHDSIKKEFDDLHSSFMKFQASTMDVTNTHDTFITSLQQRFDNLTTDHMVQCIINQFQLLYPAARAISMLTEIPRIQQYLGQVTAYHQRFEQCLQRNQSQVANLEQRWGSHQCENIRTSLTERIDSERSERIHNQNALILDLNQRFKTFTEEQQRGGADNHAAIVVDVHQRLKTYLEEQESKSSQYRTTVLADVEQRLKANREEQEAKPRQDRDSILEDITQKLKSHAREQELAQSRNREEILADIERRLKAHIVEQDDKLSKSHEIIVADIQGRHKVFTKEQHDIYATVKQDTESHLNRLEALQKNVQPLRTEHATELGNLSREIQDLKTAMQNQTHNPGIEDIQATLTSIQDQLKDFRDAYYLDILRHYVAIDQLNKQCGVTNELLNDYVPDEADTPDHPADVRIRARSASISLGQPSSPHRPPSQDSNLISFKAIPAEPTSRQASSNGRPITSAAPASSNGTKAEIIILPGASQDSSKANTKTPVKQKSSASSTQETTSRSSAGTGTREAPLTLSQSTDGADDDSDDPPIINRATKRKRKPTKKSEESPMKARKTKRNGS